MTLLCSQAGRSRKQSFPERKTEKIPLSLRLLYAPFPTHLIQMFRPVANRLSLNARASIYQIWRRSLVPSFVALRPITARQEYLLHTSPTPPLQHQPVSVPTFSSEDTVHIVNDKSGPSEPQSNPNGSYNYVVAASWHPKNRNTRKSKDSAEKIPYWKRKQVGKVDAGEDAFFHTNTRKGLAVGVADGVGGWAEVGVDPGN